MIVSPWPATRAMVGGLRHASQLCLRLRLCLCAGLLLAVLPGAAGQAAGQNSSGGGVACLPYGKPNWCVCGRLIATCTGGPCVFTAAYNDGAKVGGQSCQPLNDWFDIIKTGVCKNFTQFCDYGGDYSTKLSYTDSGEKVWTSGFCHSHLCATTRECRRAIEQWPGKTAAEDGSVCAAGGANGRQLGGRDYVMARIMAQEASKCDPPTGAPTPAPSAAPTLFPVCPPLLVKYGSVAYKHCTSSSFPCKPGSFVAAPKANVGGTAKITCIGSPLSAGVANVYKVCRMYPATTEYPKSVAKWTDQSQLNCGPGLRGCPLNVCQPVPTSLPTPSPTLLPSTAPTTSAPSTAPTTSTPTTAPTFAPTGAPTLPTAAPTHGPTGAPTPAPTLSAFDSKKKHAMDLAKDTWGKHAVLVILIVAAALLVCIGMCKLCSIRKARVPGFALNDVRVSADVGDSFVDYSAAQKKSKQSKRGRGDLLSKSMARGSVNNHVPANGGNGRSRKRDNRTPLLQ